MPCYFPLKGYRSHIPNASGKYGVFFNLPPGSFQAPMQIPCGQCIGCRLERSRQWALRCVHEASLYPHNCFITLTYSDEFLPADMSLNKRHFQLFMKKLRKRFGSGIRFFHCGEYGERFGRPHYHACIFNFDFPDKKLWKISNGDLRLYTSESLSELWGFGFCTIGDCTFESAAYVARYVLKKVTGDRADEHYTYIDEGTGEFFNRLPEYTTMSRRPGIGRRWFDKFVSDVFPDDFIVSRGLKMKPPKYYNRQYEIDDPISWYAISDRRRIAAAEQKHNSTPDRLKVRERVVRARISNLKRSVDDDT